MKTICIYPNSQSGYMSAAIVKNWFIERSDECNIVNLNSHYSNIEVTTKRIRGQENNIVKNTLYIRSWDYGDDLPDLSEYDKVIMVGVSFPKEKMADLYERYVTNFIWFYHHIPALKENDIQLISGIQNNEKAACVHVWDYFFSNDPTPEIVRLLGMYESNRYKGTDEEQKVLGFQYGAKQKIYSYEDAHEWLTMCIDHPEIINEIQNAGDEIYDYLCTEAKQTYKNAFPIELTEIVTPGNAAYEASYKFICVNKERFNPNDFGIDYHKDGYDGAASFWYKEGKWHFTLYNDNGQVDVSKIAKQYRGDGTQQESEMVVDTQTMLNIINQSS